MTAGCEASLPGSADTLVLRPETSKDAQVIHAVVEAAFGQPDEAELVAALRRDGDAAVSLVACDGETTVGHVLLSRMRTPEGALGLAPVSVSPVHQRRGIGARLIRAGLEQAGADGWAAVFVLGDPAYYRRFGFRTELAAAFVSPYAGPDFMALELVPGALRGLGGEAAYPAAFAALGADTQDGE